MKPLQSLPKPNPDAVTLFVRNHARKCDKRVRIAKQGLRNSELSITHAKNRLRKKDCAVPPRFAYRHRTLHQLILKPKNWDDEEYIFSNLLPQASGSEKDRTVPVMGRITVDGSQTQFSCKLTVDPKLWDTKGDVSRAEARRHSKRTVCLTRCGYASTGTIRNHGA